METSVARKRKLIDLEMPVFEALTVQAGGQGLSLKAYIELLLKEEAVKRAPVIPGSVKSRRVIGLLGIAKPALERIDPHDERAQYILSK